MEISKLTLGTAQIGMQYGISNFTGKPDLKKSLKILNYAWEHQINTFDTSPLYGNSEKIIGTFIASKIDNSSKIPIIISKLPKVELGRNSSFEEVYNYITEQINNSLNNLGMERIPIYLIHNPSDIFFEDGLVFECLNEIKKEGLINKFGVSVYNPNEVEAILKLKDCDVIQIPINIFDQRLIKTGLLKKLCNKDFIILARSIYLQGLFFLSPEKLPRSLNIAKKPLIKLREIVKEYNIDIADIALLFVRDQKETTSLIIGVETINQLIDNLRLLNEKSLNNKVYSRIIEEFSDLPEKLINPAFWNK